MNILRCTATTLKQSLTISLLVLVLEFSAFAQTSDEPQSASIMAPDSWQSALYVEHSLVGRIWDTRRQRFVSISELAQAVDSAHYVLLGEKHDNPDHHQIQRNILAYLFAGNRVAAVSYEMMDSDFDQRLAGLGNQQFESLAHLKDYLQWDEEGWNWDWYGELIADTVGAGIEMRSANISRARISEVYGQALAPSIAGVLDKLAVEQLNLEIDESHCNMLPSSQFPAMVRVQQARDHAMASSLIDGRSADRKNVLIAGNYHIRKDLGVPRYLEALQREIETEDILSLALLEVSPQSDEPDDYGQGYSATNPFDFIWFTPAISDEDYCAGFAD